MSLIEAVLLSVLQGVTEFLPISSSGHLILGQKVLGITEPQLLFDIVLHMGTLVAVVGYYRRDVFSVLTGLRDGITDGLRERSLQAFAAPDGARLAVLVLITMLPTGVLGIFLEDMLDPPAGEERVFSAAVVCALLVVNGFILIANRFFLDKETVEREGTWSLWNITPALAFVIGISQGLAVMPGFSRAGLTITTALALGIWRTEAARFSFLMSIPAIVGALVLKFDPQVFAAGENLTLMLGGAVVAAITGYLSILLLVQMLKKAHFHHFAWYCWAVGIGGLVALNF